MANHLIIVSISLAALMLFIVDNANAECCKADECGYCLDQTEGSPFCGNGPCNMLGCDCEGGCRTLLPKPDPVWSFVITDNTKVDANQNIDDGWVRIG